MIILGIRLWLLRVGFHKGSPLYFRVSNRVQFTCGVRIRVMIRFRVRVRIMVSVKFQFRCRCRLRFRCRIRANNKSAPSTIDRL